MQPAESDRRDWIIAWVVALALHVVAILVFASLARLAHPRTQPPDAVQVMLVPDDPRTFTEQPPDRAEQTSENAQALSNVTSRARDQEPGGSAALPRARGDNDVPAVKLAPKQASSEFATPTPQSTDPFSSRLDRVPPPSGHPVPPGPTGPSGNSDVPQPDMNNPDGNAALTGDISLSTTEWNYSPWLQRFGREVMRRWIAPPAYRMGLLKDGGWAVIDMEIMPDGKVLRVDLVGQQGHPSLILAAQSALHGMNPVEPLPADFPDKTLILHIRMVYPKYSEIRPAEGEPELPHRGRRR